MQVPVRSPLPCAALAALSLSLLATLAGPAKAQAPPDAFYYKFDVPGSSVPNEASPGVGANPAPVNGHTMGGVGQFGSALQGAGGASSSNFVDTGWQQALGTSDWTVGFWIDISGVAGADPFMYVFGDEIGSSYRVFTNGAGGSGNIIMRGNGISDVIIPGGAPAVGAAVVAWVYDSGVPEIRGYLNGTRVATVSQAPLNLSSVGNLKFGGYGTSGALAVNGLMDECRFYFRALTDAEVQATWDVELGTGCQITAPAPGATVGGTVPVDFDLAVPAGPVDATFSFSTDAGANWSLATPAGASTNPMLGLPSPGSDTFSWDTVADAVGLLAPTSTDFRVEVVDPGLNTSTCQIVGVIVDNVPPAPTCTLVQATPGPATGMVNLLLTPDSLSAPTVDATMEFSLDAGVTWQIATASGGLANPLVGLPVGSPASFLWDSRGDGVGLVVPVPAVVVRATVDDGTPVHGTCEAPPFAVDNTQLCAGTCGDCNLDTQGPDIIDALTGAQIAAFLVTPSVAQAGCCDVDSDTVITVIDALLMAQAAAQLPTTLVCP